MRIVVILYLLAGHSDGRVCLESERYEDKLDIGRCVVFLDLPAEFYRSKDVTAGDKGCIFLEILL